MRLSRDRRGSMQKMAMGNTTEAEMYSKDSFKGIILTASQNWWLLTEETLFSLPCGQFLLSDVYE